MANLFLVSFDISEVDYENSLSDIIFVWIDFIMGFCFNSYGNLPGSNIDHHKCYSVDSGPSQASKGV